MSFLSFPKLTYGADPNRRSITYYVIIGDLKNLVPFGHKELWRPLAANGGCCDLNNVVASGHNQLWRPLVAKFHL